MSRKLLAGVEHDGDRCRRIGPEQLAETPVRRVEQLERLGGELGFGRSFERHGEMRSDRQLHAVVQIGLAPPAFERRHRLGFVAALSSVEGRRHPDERFVGPDGKRPLAHAVLQLSEQGAGLRELRIQRERALALLACVGVAALERCRHRGAEMQPRVLRIGGGARRGSRPRRRAPGRRSARPRRRARRARCADRFGRRGRRRR